MSTFIARNEIPRKVLHGSIGIITALLYSRGVQLSQVTPVLISMLVPIASIEILRLRIPAVNALYIRLMGPLMRDTERNGRVNGVIWYLVGLILVFAVFPKDISGYAIYLLSWADLAASTVGRALGGPKITGNKSLSGSLAAWAAGIAAGLVWYGYLIPKYSQYNGPQDIYFQGEGPKQLVFCILGGLAGSLAELVPIIDDNLSIPILSSIALYAVATYMN